MHQALFVVGEGEIPSCEGTTQGDPLAMAMYALAVVPLIKRLRVAVPSVGQIWFADDATAVGKLKLLHKWWQILSSLGPNFGYFSNASKTVLIVKPHLLTIAKSIFADTGMQITDQGQRHLGAALGSREFAEGFVAKKVCSWSSEVLALAEIATNRPHSAFCAFTHGMIGRWIYIMRTIPNVGPLFQPLEDAIRLKLIPALTGHGACSALERDVLSLPCRLGGLGIVIPVDIANSQFTASIKITHSLRSLIVAQNLLAPLPDVKAQIHQDRRSTLRGRASAIKSNLSSQSQRVLDLNSEPGASAWLTALPLAEQGFHLTKQEFWDALHLRYGWKLLNIPSHCVCGVPFSADHAMICRHGGLTFVRHNALQNITAEWLSKTCHGVALEPPLQPLTGEIIAPKTANRQDEARADIHARGFWGQRQSAFFDVRVFHPNAPSYCNTSVPSLYRRHEAQKKREYGDRVREVEQASFTPLVFATTGGMGREAIVFYRRLADHLSRRGSSYSQTLAFI